MGTRDEELLAAVRRDLDELAARRLMRPLTPREQARYRALCRAEYEGLGRPARPIQLRACG